MLLDVLREDLGLTGTKDGCREGDCGACLVLLGSPRPDGMRYRTVNSCLLPMGDVAGRHVVTIEGLNQPDLSPVQKALLEEGAIQCGFCTPGLVIALTGFLFDGAAISEADGIAALGGNICRCTGSRGHPTGDRPPVRTIPRPRTAGGTVLFERESPRSSRRQVLPRYFLDVPARLRGLTEAAAGRPSGEERGVSFSGPGRGRDGSLRHPGR